MTCWVNVLIRDKLVKIVTHDEVLQHREHRRKREITVFFRQLTVLVVLCQVKFSLLSNPGQSNRFSIFEPYSDTMRITGVRRAIHALLMGPPGSGKGTISTRMARDFDMYHLSSGDLLRNEINDKAKLGLMAKQYIDAGKLVPDHVMVELILSQLCDIPSNKSWVLDGFPRTVAQAEALSKGERIDTVINLDVPFDTIRDRLTGRWIHPGSGRVYNDGFNPPFKPGYDDVTGEPLIQRDDDKPETVTQRLSTYEEQTRPLLEFYRSLAKNQNLLHSFSGTESDVIWPHILKYLKTLVEM